MLALSAVLFTADPREPSARQALIDALGAEDADVLVRWLWERHRSGSPSFADVLVHIVAETEDRGPAFARGLLEQARKPREVRELEMALLYWAKPKIEGAMHVIRGHRGSEAVAKREYADLAVGLMEWLHKQLPGVCEPVLRGAVIAGFQHKAGGFTFEASTIARAVHTPPPAGMGG